MTDASTLDPTHAFNLWGAAKALLLILVGWLVAKGLQKLFMRATINKLSAHSSNIYGRALFYGTLALFAIMGMDQMGFEIGVLLGAAGILSVAIGFASQTSASNLISGLFLLGEKPFQIGDLIQVGADRGEVISFDLLSVKLRTFDNLFVRIPNESLIKTTLINLSRFPIRRIDLTIGVAYKEDLRRVIAILHDVASEELRILEEPAPLCTVMAFSPSSIDLQLSVWTQFERFREVKSDLLIRIKEAFEREGVEIPFPHVTVYTGSQTAPFPLHLQTTEAPQTSG